MDGATLAYRSGDRVADLRIGAACYGAIEMAKGRQKMVDGREQSRGTGGCSPSSTSIGRTGPTGRRPRVKGRFVRFLIPLLLVAFGLPLTVHAVGDASRNPQPTASNNYNDVQDLLRLHRSGTGIRPNIASGSDTISGRVTDASTGAGISGVTVYLSDVPSPCNNSISAGPCAPAMQTTTTDSTGAYSFTGIGNGSYNLAASRLTAGSTMYPQTAPGVVPTTNSNQQGVSLNLTVSGNTTANFVLRPFAAPGSRTAPSGHAKNLIVVDFDETYAKSWFGDSNLTSLSTNVNSFANGGVNNTNGFATYGWSPVDHYSIATGQYPYWRFWDPWPNNLCNWATSGNGGADCGIDTNKFYCSGSCVPEAWGQMSMFDVAKAYGMSTAVIGGSDYPTGHINNANVDSIQLGANSQCPSAGSSCQWETEAENWISGTGGPNSNGFLLYMPVTPAEGSTPESASPDASGSAYQTAQQRDDQVFGDFRSWLSSNGYLANTDVVLVADEAENDHTSYDNFYGTNTTKNVPVVFGGPDYPAGQHPTNLIHLDDVAATSLGGLCLPAPAGDRGTVQTSYLKAPCASGGPTATPPPAATTTPAPVATTTPVPAATNTPAPGATATNTPAPGATATNTPASGANCTSDNVCLTSFTASASSAPVNTNVTLTANTSADVGPTPYYILIVDETGTILTSCSSGASCSTTVTSAVAATHQYTAYLSGSSTSNSANARSSTVSVSWTSSSASPTPTKPSLPTATPTKPSLPTATNTPAPAATNTPTNTPAPAPTNTPRPAPTNTPAPTGNIVVNPGFESGPGVGWSESSSGGYEVIDTYRPHAGSYSADECNYNNCTDYVQQQVTVPSNASLRYWWYMTTSESSTTTAYDYLRVQVYSTSGTLLGTLRTWSNTSARNAWSQDTLSLAAYAGQTVVLRFTTTTDYTMPTNFFIDDVSVP